ncbi:MAG: type IVB secretion system protein IcmH/DotU [Burkholderiaceae bacterium]|nr:type IVB secretion system protein IcmH/DotU [Burkholderiaceae bacterium]
MPIKPPASSADSDPDTPFGTQLSVRGGAAPGRGASRRAVTPSCPNPLISEADELLALVPQLRSTAQIADLAQLRDHVSLLLQRFDESLRQRKIAAGLCQKAHFVLCALIDEVVQAMPWGANGAWERLNPLEAVAGANPTEASLRAFAQMATDRTGSRELRELIYVALALSFDARGRITAAGVGQADTMRARLADSLKRKGDAAARALSARWQPVIGRASALGSWLPLWVGICLVGALLAVLYAWLTLALASQSDRVFARITALHPPIAAAAAPAAAVQPRLTPLLAQVQPRGLQVRDEIDRSIVTLDDRALFEPGDASLLRAGADSLRPVARALQAVPGQVVVIGHTDGETERSARFSSNWELSVERARAVRDALLLFGVPSQRMRYDGRADSEPLAAESTNHTLPHSGRIEIELLVGR